MIIEVNGNANRNTGKEKIGRYPETVMMHFHVRFGHQLRRDDRIIFIESKYTTFYNLTTLYSWSRLFKTVTD